MKLFDVNILINAHRAENPGHAFYRRWLTDLLQGPDTFLYCELVLSSFIRVVTHPKIYRTPTPLTLTMAFTNEIRACPNGVAIMPGARHWEIFSQLCHRTEASGNLIPDAYLAALGIEADAEWISADEDFAAFEPELNWQLLRP